MKKLIFILPIIFLGCATASTQSARERNEKCSEFEEVEVFQTFNDGGLAYVCERKSYDNCAMGMTVAVLKERGEDLWDSKRIKAPKGKCFAYDGVYKYISKDERGRTVPIVRLDYAYAPSSEKEALERVEDLRVHLYHECLDEANAEFINEKETNTNKCKCFADLTVEKLINIASMDNQTQDTVAKTFGKSFITEAEKACGKMPKNIKI
ncbi:hypothetical protein Emin_1455 [Elusimicrobium minutum Pei191]|uniref:Lipoprotein n=1 Tax=Elusimicrobium minutum (strain Pei191) TaxID=445932 RepID=B2KEQ7_ELUMP|nr:hypothetical protein [Elusimicrobium minutum]ACC99003.1 hypothetical protein Emin_1455 [Elusimicrobium minutum Pei191]